MILTPADARTLYQVAKLGDLRQRHRVGNTPTYELLTAITITAFQVPAEDGILPRHDAASDESGQWTVRRIARAAGLSERKVRFDCQHGYLPASKRGSNWLIEPAEADTYIARGRRR
jgi:hypothetical protein